MTGDCNIDCSIHNTTTENRTLMDYVLRFFGVGNITVKGNLYYNITAIEQGCNVWKK